MRPIINYPASTKNYSRMTNKRIRCIVIHYVGGVSSALANAQNLRNNQAVASAQYFVDQTSIYQTVADSDAAWGCSAVRYAHPYARNTTCLHIEMCCKRSPQRGWYIEPDTIENTALLTALLMRKYAIPLRDVLRHYDVTGKHCPEPFVRSPSAWVAFLAQVEKNRTGRPSNTIAYRVRLTADDKKSQLGAFVELASAKQLAKQNPGYGVYDLNGNTVF